MSAAELEYLKSCFRSYPDFPKKGILFQDVFSVLSQPEAFALMMKILVDRAKASNPDAILGLESRGFLFGPHMALQLGVPFVPIRKKGKLPGNVLKVTYQLEYGEDIFEMQEDALKKGQKVLIVDDLIATGGSLGAACELVKQSGCSVVNCLAVMELSGLKGRDKVPAPVNSLIQC